jgi:hypothetical protein
MSNSVKSAAADPFHFFISSMDSNRPCIFLYSTIFTAITGPIFGRITSSVNPALLMSTVP